ncbi:MAG: two-component regulator propeller domain-containing protein [Anaerolineales bacterium]
MKSYGVGFFIHRILIALAVASILIIPKFITPVYAQADTPRFETISTEQGLSQSTVHAILQDQQGFMWFGTEGGLNKFDGYQFTVYKHDPDNSQSLSDNPVQSMYQDRDGVLWIGTGVGLDRFDFKTDTFLHYPQDLTGSPDLSGHSISIIFQDQSGILWVGTDGGGLAAVDLTTNKFKIFKHSSEDPQSLSDNTVDSIYEDRIGELWIGTDAGLDRFDKTTAKFIPYFRQAIAGSPIIDNIPVYAIYEDGQEALWFGTKNGLFQLNQARDQLIAYQHDPDASESLSDDTVTCILEDSQGSLWIGTRNGLDQFNKTLNRFTQYKHSPNDLDSLTSNSIRTIYEDRSGVMWIGTSGGLNKYARATQKFSLYQNHPEFPNSFSDNNIWSIYEDHLDNLWVGTFSSGLDLLDRQSGNITVYQNNPANPTSLSSNEIRAILEDHNGYLWIGMERGGLDRFDPETDTFIHYRHNDTDPGSLSQDDVFSIYEDHQGRLWIGTQRGGLDQYNQATGNFSHYQHDVNDPLSLSDNNVRVIYEDSTGVLWVGTFGGIDLLDNQTNHFTVYHHDPNNMQSLSNDMVNCIFEDQNGTVWVGTFGGGLNSFDRTTQSFAHYTSKDGLPDDTVYGILTDPNGALWLSTNKGLSKFDPSANTFRNYDVSDGLQGDQFNPGAFFQSKNGEMFFGGTQGLNAFYPEQVADNPVPPPVVITAFQKYNQTIQTDLAPNETIQLSYQDTYISFEFAALDYNAPGKNLYAYQLEGVDKDWVYAGTRRYAGYTNLHGGDYIFRVKASNNDGVWNSEGTAIRIHITPPFWQTWWFIGLIGLTLVGGSIGGYRLRVRDVEARNRELVKKVEQRTHELATLNTISEVVNRSLDLTEILNAALDKTIEVMRMDGGLAYRLEETDSGTSDGPLLRLLAHRGVSDEYINIVKVLPLHATLIEETVKTGKPDVRLVNNHPNPQIRKAIEEARVRLAINVPLLVQGKLVGALTLATWEMREITQEELSLLMAISQQVSMAVVNAQLYERAEQTAIITERTRLARELHDSVTQLLYSVTLYAEAAAELLDSGETATAASHLRELRDTSQEALREMRLLIFELHRPALAQGGLTAALQARLDAVERRGGMHAELLVEGEEMIGHPVQEELYNIAHEALNNVLKHAHANSVRIQLRFGDVETEIEISDDGVGFEPTLVGTGGGFGIPGMQERSQKIGGILHINSAPGKGTTVVVRVPVNFQEHPNQVKAGSHQKEAE